jgi:hypothetical protein
LLDQLFMTNVGAGLLLVTSLDHADDPGRYLLHRLIAYAAGNGARAERSLAPERLRGFAVQPSS